MFVFNFPLVPPRERLQRKARSSVECARREDLQRKARPEPGEGHAHSSIPFILNRQLYAFRHLKYICLTIRLL